MSYPAKILCIDDAEAHIAALEELLHDLWSATEVFSALTLAEGMRLYTVTRPEFVLTDLRLPDSPPERTVETLAAIIPPTVPLVIISGSVASIEGIRYVAQGADAFLGKGTPLEIIQRTLLMAWIGSVGRQQRAARQLRREASNARSIAPPFYSGA